MATRVVIGLLVSGLLTGCGSETERRSSLESDLEAIEHLLEQEVAAVNAGDVEAVLALRTPDCVQMPPDALPSIGRDAIRSSSEAFFDRFRVEVTDVSTKEIQVMGDWAFWWGFFSWTLTPRAGDAPFDFTGKILWIVERRPDGAWKISREVWNGNPPPAGG